MTQEQTEIVLLRDKEWRLLDSELCLVSIFQPFMGSGVKDGKAISPDVSVPYAEIKIECRLSTEKIAGFITHKEDFINLWAAFKDRGVNQDKEEVLIYWTTQHYTSSIGKLFSTVVSSSILPKMIVMVCPKGTYESCPDGLKWPPKEDPLVLVHGLGAISWWIPAIMTKKA